MSTGTGTRRRTVIGGVIALVVLAVLGVPLLLGSGSPPPTSTAGDAARDPQAQARLDVPGSSCACCICSCSGFLDRGDQGT